MNIKNGRIVPGICLGIRPYEKPTRNQLPAILAACFLLFLATVPAQAAVIQAASCSYDDVKAAVDAAQPGDTVRVPAGEAVWTKRLLVNKGIRLMGAGRDKTIIKAQGLSSVSGTYIRGLLTYWPSNPEGQYFRLSGFSFDGDIDSYYVVYLRNDLLIPAWVRIDNNLIQNGSATGFVVQGTVYGVVDNNIIENSKTDGKCSGFYGVNSYEEWETMPREFGDAYNIYVEDNTFVSRLTISASGQGGRYLMRYNFAYGFSRNICPLHDMHGNQTDDSPSNWGTMIGEFYGNHYITNQYGANFMGQRGGKALVFGNNIVSTLSSWKSEIWEEYNDATIPKPNPFVQKVIDSYYWNNRLNDTMMIGTIKTIDCCNALEENRDYFQQSPSGTPFDGTSGIGCGTVAEFEAFKLLHPICTPGVGYWVSDQPCNRTHPDHYGTYPKEPLRGTLYKYSASGVWEEYYTPYTYPHPFRVSGPLADEQTLAMPLQTGWNWISFNVLPSDRSMNSVFGGILGQVEQVRTQTQSAMRVGSNWIGDLANLDGIQQGRRYKVRVSANCSLTVTGTQIAANTPISLVSGWNWAAYYPSSTLAIGTALNSINSQVQQARSQTQSALFNGSTWTGDLSQMEPGKGYTIRVSGPVNLIYPGE